MKKLMLMTGVLLMVSLTGASGQTSTFKALFLYNFSINMNWEDESVGEFFTITVVGDNEIVTELEKISKVKKVGSKSIEVKSVKNVADVTDSQLIFLGDSKSSQMDELKTLQEGKHVLLVSDKSGLCKQGAGISFTSVDGKLRYEICPQRIEEHGLQTSQKVVSLGIKVQ